MKSVAAGTVTINKREDTGETREEEARCAACKIWGRNVAVVGSAAVARLGEIYKIYFRGLESLEMHPGCYRELVAQKPAGITSPGEYQIALRPGSKLALRSGTTTFTFCNCIKMEGEQPHIAWSQIGRELCASFTNLENFVVRGFGSEKEIVPTSADCKYMLNSGPRYLTSGNETCEADEWDNSSDGCESFIFSIKDVPSLPTPEALRWIGVPEAEWPDRIKDSSAPHQQAYNGRIRMHMEHQFPRWNGDKPELWVLNVEFNGDTPGPMIKRVLDYVNSEIAKTGAPVWKNQDYAWGRG